MVDLGLRLHFVQYSQISECPAPFPLVFSGPKKTCGNEVRSLESVCQTRKGGLRVPGDFREAASRPFHLLYVSSTLNLTHCIWVVS